MTIGKLLSLHPEWAEARAVGIDRTGGIDRMDSVLKRDQIAGLSKYRVMVWWRRFDPNEGSEPVPTIVFRYPPWRKAK